MSETTSEVPNLLERAWPAVNWRDLNVALAVSGGADSVALFRAVLELKQRAGGAGKLFALHVNHQLRSAESNEDAAWCERLCQSLGVPITVLTGNAPDRAAADGDGIEAAARAERYQLLTQAAEREGARYLATAHTRDDQVETVLLRMLRGAGLRGLSGIPRVRALSNSLTLVRPLLDVPRESVREYLSALGQDYRTDSSNESLRFTRNRVRHRLLPWLRTRFSADVDAALLRGAEQAGNAQELIEGLAAELLAECGLRISDRGLSLGMEPLSGKPRVVACEVLRLAWREAKLPEQAMTYEWWQRLAHLGEGEVLNLPGNARASRSDRRLSLEWL